METPDCFLCRIAAGGTKPPGELLYTDGVWFICHAPLLENDRAALPGMLVIATHGHTTDIGSLSHEQAWRKGLVEKLAVLLIEQALAVESAFLFHTNEHTPHVHSYAIPRYPQMRGDQTMLCYQIFTVGVWMCGREVVTSYVQTLAAGIQRLHELDPGLFPEHAMVSPPAAPVVHHKRTDQMSIVTSYCCGAPIIRGKQPLEPLRCSKCKGLPFAERPTGHPTR